jgi:hypothetical protein
MFKVPGKLSTDERNLRDMTVRNPITPRRVTWRHRFLEIARQFEAAPARPQMGGLRPRAKMAGFATLRRPTGPAA